MRPFYRTGHYNMKNSVGYLVRRAGNLVLPQLEALFADEEMTFSQWTVLKVLRELGESTAAELARNMCHDAGSVTRILDQLEQRGLIARLRSDTDRRVVALSLTPRGAETVERLIPLVMDHWNGLLAGFSHAEAKTLISLLTRLVDAAGGPRDELGQARRTGQRKRQRHQEHPAEAPRRRGRAS